jgi:hypothetical protein
LAVFGLILTGKPGGLRVWFVRVRVRVRAELPVGYPRQALIILNEEIEAAKREWVDLVLSDDD